MSYRFRAGEPVSAAMRRCAGEQLDKAVDQLTEAISQDPIRAVHGARKAIKKERALLRLARGPMPAGQRRRENAALRAAAGRLTGARDADAMIATLDRLAERFAGQLPASTFEAIREELVSRRPSPGGESESDLAGVVRELRAARQRVDDWDFGADGWSGIDAGLMRSYREGRRAFKRARHRPSLEDLHTWRKRVKDLWYQERLLESTCGAAVRGHAEEAGVLAELLGDDHDLGVLRQQLAERMLTAPVDVDALIRLIEHRQSELQGEAVLIGARLYAERPAQFQRRMRRSWKVGWRLADAPFEGRPADLSAATRTPQAI